MFRKWAALAVLASLVIVVEANAEPSLRTRTWEMSLQPRYQFQKDLEFTNARVEMDDDFAWGFGINYNVSEKLQIGTEFGWNFIDYKASFLADSGGVISPRSAGGSAETSSWLFNMSYNLLATKFTPFVTAGLGWGWFDSNIATGDWNSYCWWDPWYGYICSSYPSTYGDDAFVYKAGGGLRMDSAESFFFKVMYNAQWNDFGNSSNVPMFSQIRVEFGSMFR